MTAVLIKMVLVTGLMCGLVAGWWFLENKTRFKQSRPWLRKLLCGLIFGGAAIISTHYGVNYGDMVLNVRDLAPLSAGLFFHPAAGIIAGLVGGLERYIAGQCFGVGAYSSLACAISTALAGVLAAVCRKYLFEGKLPTALYGFMLGAIMEVFHMLMLLLTHMDDINTAFEIVRICAPWMILFTAAGLAISSVIIAALSRRLPRWRRLSREETPISWRFQGWLLLVVCAMLALTFAFTYVAQTRLTQENAASLLRLNADDIEKELRAQEVNLHQAEALLKRQAINSARAVADDVAAAGGGAAVDNDWLRQRLRRYNIYEINVVDKTGIIIASTNEAYVGFDMAAGGQSAEFMVLAEGEVTEMIQDFQPISYDSSISIMYAGVAIPDGYIQVGYNDEDIASFEQLADVSSLAAERHIGESGSVFLAEMDGVIVSKSDSFRSSTLAELGLPLDPKMYSFFFARLEGGEYYCYYCRIGPYLGLLTMSVEELYQSRDIFAYETAFMEILVFAVIFGLILVLVRKIIVRNLHLVNESLTRITGGDLNERVEVLDSAEFASLSEDINSTVSTLKRYIAEAENRINAELEFARAIQLSALPNVFPPFPERDEFELYASMDTAKEVGGDFYDFFLVDPDRLALVMADVSGKGIPAALFMMKSKTLIKSLAESGLSPAEILTAANEKLCEGNEAEMFVTVWLGLLHIPSGRMVCVNAGHEFPCLRRGNGEYELFRDKHGFVLGGMETARYSQYEIQMQPGDALFVYTDGVAEATDTAEQLFGTDRLLAALNSDSCSPPEQTLLKVKEAVSVFAGEAQQFDDITMLAIEVKRLSG